jgi:hypothetical protein
MNLARMAFEQAWQLTALIVVIWLTTRWVTRKQAHLAYMLWLVVLLKAITPPVWSSPSGVFSWVQASLATNTNMKSATLWAIELPPSCVVIENAKTTCVPKQYARSLLEILELKRTVPPYSWHEAGGGHFTAIGASCGGSTAKTQCLCLLLTACKVKYNEKLDSPRSLPPRNVSHLCAGSPYSPRSLRTCSASRRY